ncbi:uncharacterized protein LOC120850886 [Ixodes scapularis]|uniref:uncharacterized protein LOC120850886 n=1 Tax=Ixodes scapularis TaxID=6945 RepID=UPI001A9F2F16|nr:uncharacterized protein LOC120850886 [Ixodes scapularis]
MQLVVLSVVLILPSFLSGETFSHTTEVSDECGLYIEEGGSRECTLLRSTYKNFNSTACAVLCKNGEQRLFPEGVCSNGAVNCTSEVKTKLRDWSLEMDKEYYKKFGNNRPSYGKKQFWLR